MKTRFTLGLALATTLGILSGCGNAVDCALNGDNLTGQITFGNGIPIVSGSDIVVQWSTDSFVATRFSTIQTNAQGLVSAPYSFCLDTDKDFQFFAFQDLNRNGTQDAGEPSGRFDGTDNGNATYLSKRLTKDANGQVVKAEDVDIVIDTP